MSRIFCLIGKSGSGKDTIYREILRQADVGLVPVIPYTTRPKRTDEVEGLNYHFVTEEQLEQFRQQGRVMECRQYHTVQGIWSYFTLQFDLEKDSDYILITTLEGVDNIVRQYGSQMVHVVYLYIGDKERLIRCIQRESQQKNPNYTEVCRRFIADQQDFSDEKLELCTHVHTVHTDQPLWQCLQQWNRIYQSVSVNS